MYFLPECLPTPFVRHPVCLGKIILNLKLQHVAIWSSHYHHLHNSLKFTVITVNAIVTWQCNFCNQERSDITCVLAQIQFIDLNGSILLFAILCTMCSLLQFEAVLYQIISPLILEIINFVSSCVPCNIWHLMCIWMTCVWEMLVMLWQYIGLPTYLHTLWYLPAT